MARPNKEGLDYFPLDVDFFDDDKIQLIEGEFGPKGSLIAVKLLCKIYKEHGYYYQWGEDQCLLFSKGAGLVQNLVNEVVQKLIKRAFFDERVFNEFHVLTSRGIQNRYLSAVKSSKIKRDPLIEKYDLIKTSEEMPKTSEEMPKTSEEMPKTSEESTQRKVKKRKEKKRRGNNSEENFRPPDLSGSNLFREPVIPTKNEVWECFVQNGGTKEMAKSFWDRNEATGWFWKSSPITDFRSMVGSYVENWKKNESHKPKQVNQENAAAARKIQEEKSRAIINGQ